MTNELMLAAGNGGNSEMMAAIIGGVVGSLVGGLCSFIATRQAHGHSLDLERIQTEETIDGILQAIQCESKAVMKSFEWFGEQLNEVPSGGVFAYTFQIQRSYFNVYPNNTTIVGQIKDAELVQLVISSYIAGNTFLDAIAVNDNDEQRFREYQKLRDSDPALYGRHYEEHRQRMANFVPLLRRAYQELREEAEKLAKAIDAYRLKHPVKR